MHLNVDKGIADRLFSRASSAVLSLSTRLEFIIFRLFKFPFFLYKSPRLGVIRVRKASSFNHQHQQCLKELRQLQILIIPGKLFFYF